MNNDELRAIRTQIMEDRGIDTQEAIDVIAGLLTLSPLTVKDMFGPKKPISDKSLKALKYEMLEQGFKLPSTSTD